MRGLAVTMFIAGLAMCGFGWAITAMALDVLLEEQPPPQLSRHDAGEAWDPGERAW